MDAAVKFAVLVPLVEANGELHLLYEVRAATLQRQPGEVCFPGGRIEEGETAVQCALRETKEELSIPSSAIRVLGPLDFICHRSNFVLYPILSMVAPQAVSALVPNPAEVERTFLVPLSALRAMVPEEYSYDLVPAPGAEFPFERIGIPRNYPWNAGVVSGLIYPWQDKTIWGMTARITQHVLSLLDAERM
jgi:8-oxo-dGTP pyrophosphatase MutT (NUDIX family)